MPFGCLTWLVLVFITVDIGLQSVSSIVPDQILWLTPTRAPCFHPGQVLVKWTIPSNCTRFHSHQVTYDQGLLFARNRVCFFDQPLKMIWSCSRDTPSQSLFIGHPLYSNKRGRGRSKRWFRRRNEMPPPIHFKQEQYSIELLEDVVADTIVVTVSAEHEKQLPLYYSMVTPEDTRSSNIFVLDTITGQIKLAKHLDRETLDRHVLKVTAYLRHDPSISARTTVIVTVLDVQDCSPVFERTLYFAEIREDAPIGTTVLSVFARDLDSGDNGLIDYSLAQGEGIHLLRIQSESGVIQTAAELDREQLEMVRLLVKATDRGTPSRSGSAHVEIQFIDVNDNPPRFEEEKYTVDVLENITIPVIVTKVKAIDADTGQNALVHYSLVSSTGGRFSVDYDTGEVTMRQLPQHSVSLQVRAKDSAVPSLSSTVSITIRLIDINDHRPEFVNARQTVSVSESVPIGHEVHRVYAIDQDTGSNGIIHYLLNNSSSTDFIIDESTGIIRTKNTLDRERQSTYELVIWAIDGAEVPLNSSALITVTVDDVNDNSPIFEHLVYNVSIQENERKGMEIIRIKAHDADKEQKINYRILDGNEQGTFALIDQGVEGALLTLTGDLHGSVEMFRLRIEAMDMGSRSGICLVQIMVTDINSPPIFDHHPFSVHIPENSPIGTNVLMMHAIDKDRRENAQLHYELHGSKQFNIDPITGLITVSQGLDREQISSYSLTMSVIDNGSPPLITQTQLEVVIDDVNDNAPQFSTSTYTVSLAEDAPIGTSFLQVIAIDVDMGQNAQIDYNLEDGDDDQRDFFRLDRTSGTLRVNRALDREHIPIHHINISATDRGIPSLSSIAQVTVQLSDTNDNPPRFDRNQYDLWIAENSPVGSLVGTLLASDVDEGENARIVFRIFGGSEARHFEIEADPKQNGVVKVFTRSEFDYEAKTNNIYHLEVQASSGQLSSVVPVMVHISDVNDHRPILRDFVVLLANYRTEPINTTMVNIPAFDPDRNATLEYYLQQNELVTVDKSTGALLFDNLEMWNRQVDAKYRTCVSDGPNTECANAHLVFVPINEEILFETVTVQIKDWTMDQFLDATAFARFREAIAAIGVWQIRDVRVFSIASANNTSTQLTIKLVVVDTFGQITSSDRISTAIRENRHNLFLMSGFEMNVEHRAVCSNEPCPYYQQCRKTEKFTGTGRLSHTDSFILRSLNTIGTFTCECPLGFTSSDSRDLCDQRLDACFSSPCKEGATCIAHETGFQCLCPASRFGDLCEFPTTVDMCPPRVCHSGSICAVRHRNIRCLECPWSIDQGDTDEFCRLRVIHFEGGHGFLAMPMFVPSRIEWRLSISIATIVENGLIAFAGEKGSDFIELSLVSARPRLRMCMGDVKKVVEVYLDDWQENRLADGRWHTISVELHDLVVMLSVDNCDTQLAMHSDLSIGYRRHCVKSERFILDKRCEDSAVSCKRFLDLSPPFFLGGLPNGEKRDGFDGCIANVTFNDHQTMHFSRFESWDHQNVKGGCNPMNDLCRSRPCAKCSQIWNGYRCNCPPGAYGHDCTQAGPVMGITFSTEEAYARWQSPITSDVPPLQLTFDFRTRQRDTQLMAAEFGQRSEFLLIEIESGHFAIRFAQNALTLPYPLVSDGQWHNVEIIFMTDHITIRLDYNYEKTLHLNDPLLSPMENLYTGLAPSSNHPRPFTGCIQNVRVDGKAVALGEHSKTKAGCQVPKTCTQQQQQQQQQQHQQQQQQPVCPANSRCLRDWDRHLCVCSPGYIGDSCRQPCSLTGICENNGECQPSNASSYGYECLCTDGFRGRNCQYPIIPKICPKGWFGSPYENCKPCQCDRRKGFIEQCDNETGKCNCPDEYFEREGRCLPCNCGDGSISRKCAEKTGQCHCLSPAIGQRCDRCKDPKAMLDGVDRKCSILKNRCPSQIEADVHWPITVAGVTSIQSCGNGLSGMAIRSCTQKSTWTDPNVDNCTLPVLESLAIKMKEKWISSTEMIGQLANATVILPCGGDRNEQLGYSIIQGILLNEMNRDAKRSGHIVDVHFAQNLIDVVNALLTCHNERHQLSLINALSRYGRRLCQLHREVPYLYPFRVMTNNWEMGIDTLTGIGRSVLTKYDKLINSPRNRRLRDFEIELDISTNNKENNNKEEKEKETVFSLVGDLPDGQLVVAMERKQSGLVRIVLPIRVSDWRQPICRRLVEVDGHHRWLDDESALVAVNVTHITCQLRQTSSVIFSYRLRADPGALFRWRFTENEGQLFNDLPYTGAMCTAFALALTVLALFCGVFRSKVIHRFVRCGLISSFIGNAIVFFTFIYLQQTPIVCHAQNTAIAFSTICLFSWLFLYALHIYRTITESEDPVSLWRSYACIGTIPALLISLTTLFSSEEVTPCLFTTDSLSAWLILIPTLIFLLLSFYALFTSFLILMTNDLPRSALINKLNLRSSLLLHCLLSFFCISHTGCGLWTLMDRNNNLLPLITNSLLVLSSIFIFVWINYFRGSVVSRRRHNSGSGSTLWVNDTPKTPIETMDDHCIHSPLVNNYDMVDCDGNEEEEQQTWMPDVIPSIGSRTDSLGILSPVQKILNENNQSQSPLYESRSPYQSLQRPRQLTVNFDRAFL